METMTNGVIAAINAIDNLTTAVEQAPGRCRQAVHAVATADAASWGRWLERQARRLGAVVAVLIVAVQVAVAAGRLIGRCAALLSEAAYDLGGQLRRAIDARADQLAALWVALLVGPAPAEPAAEAAAATVLLLMPAAPVFGLLPPAVVTQSSVKRRSPRRRKRTVAAVAMA